jgi:hypothetical protein
MADLYLPATKFGSAGTIRTDTGVGETSFAGVGINDATFAGVYNTGGYSLFYAEIDGTGTPDTFKWSTDGGGTFQAETVAMTGSPQALGSTGVTVDFAATTGHTLGDVWQAECRIATQIVSGSDDVLVENNGRVAILLSKVGGAGVANVLVVAPVKVDRDLEVANVTIADIPTDDAFGVRAGPFPVGTFNEQFVTGGRPVGCVRLTSPGGDGTLYVQAYQLA